MSTIFVIVLIFFPAHLMAGVNGFKLNYLGCFKTEKIRKENEASTSDILFDLWSTPKASYADEDPQRCAQACQQEFFRYAGVMKSSPNTLECSCATSDMVIRSGTGNCDNCTVDSTLPCGSDKSIYDTNFKVPSPPRQIMLLQRTENLLRVSFLSPLAPNGPIQGYKITAKPVKSYSHEFLQEKVWEVSETSQHLIGLTPGSQYNVSVVAINSEGVSSPVSALFWTKIGIPDTPPAPKILRQYRRTMTVELQQSQNTKGPISAYRLLLVDDTQGSFLNFDQLVTWNESMNTGYPVYVVAEFSTHEFPSQFVIGNGRHYGRYYNGPIPTYSHWHPTLGVISTMDGFEEVSYSVTSHDQHRHSDAIVDQSSEPDLVEIIESDSTVVKALWIAIGISGSILLLCTAVYAVLKLNLFPKSRRRRNQNANQRPENHQLTARQSSSQSSHSYPINDDHREAYTHTGFVPDEDLKSKCMEKLQQVWYVPRNFMDIPTEDDEDAVQLLSNGKYGPVYLSCLRMNSTPVMLYSIPASNFRNDNKRSSIDSLDPEKLFKDLDELTRLDKHENVVQLIGFMEDQSNMLFAVEYGGVPLKSLLLQYRQSESKGTVTQYNLLLCAMNIAEGMFHLQSYQITHGQLAACNVLIGNDLGVPKITGFGLLAADDSLDMTRWQAVEQFQNRCVKACDAWSFGVTLWEIATLGATPYADIRSEDFPKRICVGARPSQTEVMSDSLYQIMLYCWQLDRDERPDFSRLSCSIHELLPHSKENLFISQTLNYPPYIHQYEHHKK